MEGMRKRRKEDQGEEDLAGFVQFSIAELSRAFGKLPMYPPS